MLLAVTPRDHFESDRADALLDRLRADSNPLADVARVDVGGATGFNSDFIDLISGSMWKILLFVLAFSYLVLLVLLRSVLLPLKAVLMNLLSVGAAYGVMTLASKGGAFGELIGIDSSVPIAPFMPVMMFAILFGLSMDYEVFLISRIREEYLKDRNTSRAVADGLAKTARVITAAAAIMVVVFLAFVTAPDVFLKLFGIGLASAILLDATVVRMVLVPAVMQLLGTRAWWFPDWLDKILPRLHVEPEEDRDGDGIRPTGKPALGESDA